MSGLLQMIRRSRWFEVGFMLWAFSACMVFLMLASEGWCDAMVSEIPRWLWPRVRPPRTWAPGLEWYIRMIFLSALGGAICWVIGAARTFVSERKEEPPYGPL
jgi:hypothetical protein